MTLTRSEISFERFLTQHGLVFRRVPTGLEATPDYGVTIAGVEIIFEVKEIVSDRKWEDDVVHGGTVGEHIRRRINGSKRQIQSAAKQGKPTVLLIFNNYDPRQLSGTENHDFEHAMYGEYTLVIDRTSGKIVDRFHGHEKSFQRDKNTSFSALGRLREQGREAKLSVTLFENIHAAVPIEYGTLPTCFEIVRTIWQGGSSTSDVPIS